MKAVEEHIQPDTAKSGRWADEDTGCTAKALTDRLDSERSALRGAGRILQRMDYGVGAESGEIRLPSSLDRF
ncbi:hypothetical protein [Streptomyces sp. ME01-18h]|uniref:hypothetical protein n=1 Tax=Streptomyces sp. ME01-18h TaxID=462920 RepID=UPI0029AD7C2A|nr:hypothetical protein [Streptomyces sp. ME01-18h]MDX3402011.1 hypothetical protein [Streptomyces sp. ME01-18h]